MTIQIALRIPDELVEQLDIVVAEGRYPTRTDAVRAAIQELAERERRRRIDAAIVDGYTRIPPTAAEEAWASAATREMISEEPW
jgi:Arc/MetJ-type ribon-helix-helix transcriptional regulator